MENKLEKVTSIFQMIHHCKMFLIFADFVVSIEFSISCFNIIDQNRNYNLILTLFHHFHNEVVILIKTRWFIFDLHSKFWKTFKNLLEFGVSKIISFNQIFRIWPEKSNFSDFQFNFVLKENLALFLNFLVWLMIHINLLFSFQFVE